MVPEFMDRLESLRGAVGFPIPVTSGYRAPSHPREAAKLSLSGAHTLGRAVDLAVSGYQALAVIRVALALGFTGVGVAQKGKARFIHLDDLPQIVDDEPPYLIIRPRPAIWSY